MLNNNKFKWWFLSTYVVVCAIQIISASQHQLFSDEAFYWLESQHLAWSYAELPGWTQWMIALSQKWLPQSELTVRLPTLLAAFCLPWIGMATSQLIEPKPQTVWNTGLLFLALPLLLLAGILALPDIWVVFFGVTAILLLVQCLHKNRWYWFMFLGLILAIGINVHIRFWMVIFIAALVTLWQYRTNLNLIKKLLTITFPIMLLGFVPVLIFNIQYDFPLLAFQLSDRHPWSFQASHIKFFMIQMAVTTPLMFLLFLFTGWQYKTLTTTQKTITSIAILHWLLYAVLGFFSDDLRFNWHWTLLSYCLLAVVVGSSMKNLKLALWAKVTGISCSITFIIWLFWALHISQPISSLNARFTENARGWKELAEETERQIQKTGLNDMVTDHFKTLATLHFYVDEKITLKSLNHPLNQKHGRQTQLEIMGFNQQQTRENKLLVVEHSALKSEQIVPFYHHACEQLNGIKKVGSYDYSNGVKSYYFFKTGYGDCEMHVHIFPE